MKKALLFLTAAVAVALPSPARADTTFNVEPILYVESTKSPDPSVEGSLARTFENSRWGFSGFWWVTKDWAEFHGGPTFAITPWLTVGADLGLEQDGKGGLQGRYAANVWVNKDKFSAAGCFEWGEPAFRGDWSGWWYDASATYTPFTRITAGGRGRRMVGIGPYLQVNVPEIRTKIWLLWAAADPERTNLRAFSTGLMGLTFDL
jgi:hypothetical protein